MFWEPSVNSSKLGITVSTGVPGALLIRAETDIDDDIAAAKAVADSAFILRLVPTDSAKNKIEKTGSALRIPTKELRVDR